jgi:hypothetical protein
MTPLEQKATDMPTSSPPSTVPSGAVECSPIPPDRGDVSPSVERSGIQIIHDGEKKPVLTASDKLMFRAILEGVAAFPSLAVVSNRYPWQAKLAVEKLLSLAAERKLPVRIVSGRGPEGFYNDGCCTLLAACKKSGCDVRVLIWQKDSDGISPALTRLADNGLISLRISGTDDDAGEIPHFILVGDRAFRQEAGHPPFTENTVLTETEPQVPARIDFDDSTTGKVLLDFFDKLWGPV